MPDAEVVAVSAKTGAGLDELRAALARVPVDERDADARDAALRRPRVHAAGHRHDRDRHALVGDDRRGRHAPRRAARASDVRVRSVQVHDAPVERARGRTARRGQPARRSSAATSRAATCSSSPGHYPVSYRLDVRLEEIAEIPAAVTVHVGTKAVAARVARNGAYAQLRLAEPVVAARGDRVVLRTRDDGRRRHRARPGAAAQARAGAAGGARARRPGGDRARTRPRAGHRPRAAGARPARAGRARARAGRGARRGRARVLGRVARRSCAHACARGSPRAPRPTRSTRASRSPSCCRRSRGRRTCSTCSRSSAAARRPTCPARRPRSASARRPRPSSRRCSRARRSRRSTTSSSPRSSRSEGRLRRVGDGFAVSTALYDRGLALLADARADHARGLPRRARRRSPDGAAPARALRRGRPHAAPG